MKTVYLMRLWKDGSVSPVFVGTPAMLDQYLKSWDWLAGASESTRGVGRKLYAGRHWVGAEPVYKFPVGM